MRLFLCEKPSQAKDIAKVLGASKSSNGYFEGGNDVVTWCIGHLLEAAPPEAYGEQYKKWNLQDLPILPQKWQVAVKPTVDKQFKVVQKLIGKAKELVISTDADREGEMIARELIDYCNYRGPIQRLWLSALNEASIQKALQSLKPGSETLPLYHSALSRSRADWLIGMNMTRLFTIHGRQAGYDGVLSVGRVQTPTLALVVRRDREIENFVPVPYWTIEVVLKDQNKSFVASWLPPEHASDEAGRCVQEDVATNAHKAILDANYAIVESVDTERKREAAPLAFDLGTLQEVCSKKLGLDVQETLNIAQSLYETHKATTYPRTDCGYLPESMIAEIPTVLASLVKTDPSIKPVVEQLNQKMVSRIWNDKKITAHHGIIPTLEPVNLSAMNEKELAVYKLIRSHYLAQFLAYYDYEKTVVLFNCGTEKAQAVGKRVIDFGWRVLFTDVSDNNEKTREDQTLPSMSQGMNFEIIEPVMNNLKTTPPKPYTQGDLVKSMKGIARFVTDPALKQKLKETTGIGTEATRAGIISGLLQRGYLVTKGKAVRATEAAFTLIDAIPPAIADPGMTALWEQALDAIEAGQITPEDFIARQSQWIAKLVQKHSNITLSIKLPQGPECPKCHSPMRKRQGKNGPFWSCSTYPRCDGILPIGKPKTTRKKRKS